MNPVRIIGEIRAVKMVEGEPGAVDSLRRPV